MDAQHIVDDVHHQQVSQVTGQFNRNRFALLLTPGEYADLDVTVGYYTSVIGVGRDPREVKVNRIFSLNGEEGGATQNFWRSVEGVLVKDATVWAVSQGAPMRRSVVAGDLHLSDNGGWSSGGFMAGVTVGGLLDLGTQQQWFFRNVDLSAAGAACPIGWNYVFVGVTGLDADACRGEVLGKVVDVPYTPRIAEKPYLVLEDPANDDTWAIHVPPVLHSIEGRTLSGVDVIAKASEQLGKRLSLASEVFIARPGMNAGQINAGIRGKKGLLLTPAIYTLDHPIVIDQRDFVVLGIGFPTLVAASGTPALKVADAAFGVRVAGLLLEAGTAGASAPGSPPLLVWGERKSGGRGGGGGDGGGPHETSTGVLSDLFARVGSFGYLSCKAVSVESMVEINSDDVIIDNAWLWHADHDDCGRKSDSCYSGHALIVNGDRVTSYGLSAEHTIGGDIVRWNGEDGEMYFFQSELPYHSDSFGNSDYVGYSVSPKVRSHIAKGIGIYIIGDMEVKSAYSGSPGIDLENLVTVVIGSSPTQFDSAACVYWEGTDPQCFAPEECDKLRCVLPTISGGPQPPWSKRFKLSVVTSGQPLSDTVSGATFSFLNGGRWSKEKDLCSAASSSSEVSVDAFLDNWPTALRLTAKGIDSMGIRRVTLSRDGQVRTIIDSVNGALYGHNRFWIDGIGGAVAPKHLEFDVPATEDRWRIFVDHDFQNFAADEEVVDADNLEDLKSRVEQDVNLVGFKIVDTKAYLRRAGSMPTTEAELKSLGKATVYLYDAPRTLAPTTKAPSTTRAPTTETLPLNSDFGISGDGASSQKGASERRLHVSVIGAAGLKPRSWLGGADPFCVIVLSDDQANERARLKTKLMHNTRSPQWSYSAVMQPYAETDSLEFIVLDKDFWKSNVLGRAALTADKIFPHGFDGELELTPEADGGGGGGNPSLKVKVEILSPGADVGNIIQDSQEPLTGVRSLLLSLEGGNPATYAAIVAAVAMSALAAAVLRARARPFQAVLVSQRGFWMPLVSSQAHPQDPGVLC